MPYTSGVRKSQLFCDLQQRHKNDPLMSQMETMLKALDVNLLQIVDCDDTVGIHVTFYKNNKRYTVYITD
jgi:hypothetical protein